MTDAPASPAPSDSGTPPPSSPTSPGKPPESPTEPRSPSPIQLLIGRDLVALGFLLVAGTFAIAVSVLTAAADIATVVGPITTLVGTLVGAVFGVQVGNEGRKQESVARQEAELRATEAAALVDPARGEMLLRSWRDSSPHGNPPAFEE